MPAPLVRPPLDWFAPTGVRLESGARVVILPDMGGVAEALTAKLADRGVETLRVDMAADPQTIAAQVEGWLTAGPIDGLYALAALDNEGPITDLDVDQWRERTATAGQVARRRLPRACTSASVRRGRSS